MICCNRLKSNWNSKKSLHNPTWVWWSSLTVSVLMKNDRYDFEFLLVWTSSLMCGDKCSLANCGNENILCEGRKRCLWRFTISMDSYTWEWLRGGGMVWDYVCGRFPLEKCINWETHCRSRMRWVSNIYSWLMWFATAGISPPPILISSDHTVTAQSESSLFTSGLISSLSVRGSCLYGAFFNQRQTEILSSTHGHIIRVNQCIPRVVSLLFKLPDRCSQPLLRSQSWVVWYHKFFWKC